MRKGGIILLDKKQDITSMASDNYIKKLMGTKKVGHSGTLDPFATGLLPVFVDDALKVMRYTDGYDKGYSCVVKFGERTDTQDLQGQVIGGRMPSDDEIKTMESNDFQEIRNAFEQIKAMKEQVPPMYSAKKINGVKAYDLARKGIEVELKAAPITIYNLDVDYIRVEDGAIYAKFDVECSKGTYIRKICDDLGEITGYGAHAISLRRTKCGPFRVEDAHTEEELKAMSESGVNFLVDPVLALGHIPRLEVSAKTFAAIKLGKKTPAPEGVEYDVKYAAFYGDQLAAVLYKSDEENGKTVMRIERMLASDV